MKLGVISVIYFSCQKSLYKYFFEILLVTNHEIYLWPLHLTCIPSFGWVPLLYETFLATEEKNNLGWPVRIALIVRKSNYSKTFQRINIDVNSKRNILFLCQDCLVSGDSKPRLCIFVKICIVHLRMKWQQLLDNIWTFGYSQVQSKSNHIYFLIKWINRFLF